MAIAWVNGVFSGLDHLRRLRRAPQRTNPPRGAAEERHDGLRLTSGEGKQTGKSGERVSRPVCFPGPPVEVCPAGMPTASGRRPLQERQQLWALAHKLKSNGGGLLRQHRARPMEGGAGGGRLFMGKAERNGKLFVKLVISE